MKKIFTLTEGDVCNGDNFRKNAFTLAEVLITLGIIGVIAALTMPALISRYQENVLKIRFKKAFSLISQAYKKAEADLEYIPECYYIEGAGSEDATDQDCEVLKSKVLENLKIIKTCTNNSYSNGCIPKYDALDTIKKDKKPDMTPEELADAMSGCTMWSQNSIEVTLPAYVLSDGQIMMLWRTRAFVVDVNGKSGPNKWGHDVFDFYLSGNQLIGTRFGVRQGCISHIMTSTSGHSTKEMLQNP
jgi:prepilin-type N-terminal cleavage/methylation domain-containing protein